jgi:sorting nexin-9/18/33
MAEFDSYHSQKNDDFLEVAGDHLDGEIALHEQASSHNFGVFGSL